MTPDNSITLSTDFLINDILIYAIRYIAHRRSYAVLTAKDYANIIANNRDKFDPDRLLFLARDLRAEIASRIRFCDNVTTENDSNDRIARDPLSLIKEYMMEHNIPWTQESYYHYYVDCMNCKVEAEPRLPHKDDYNTLTNETDISPLIYLADVIDRLYEVTTDYQGNEQTQRCVEIISWIRYEGKESAWYKQYHLEKNYDLRVANQYITEIKKL